jgi:UDPglucose 6-dehydrogenase
LKICFLHYQKVKEKQVLYDLNYLETRTVDENSKHIVIYNEPYEACKNAHAIAILTEWDEFKSYDWKRIYDDMKKPAFIFDGRNVLDGSALTRIGFVYQAIGS